MKRILKISLFVIVSLIGALLLLIPILVRFTDLTVSHEGKPVIGYNEETKQWIFDDWEEWTLLDADGPYVFNKGSILKVIQVINEDDKMKITTDILRNDTNTTIPVYFRTSDSADFSVKLQAEYVRDSTTYIMPVKIVAISDIEGNYAAFKSFLIANKVLNQNLKWIFDKGHLVLAGDFMDRGDAVTQTLWLIYKIEKEAREAGGKVHFILGNHEVMNLNHQTRYIHKKYIAFAQQYSAIKNYTNAYTAVFSEQNVINKWLRTKNFMTKIGDYLFLHGGVSQELLKSELTLEEINGIGNAYLNKQATFESSDSLKTKLIIGSYGPLWYRGMVINNPNHYDQAFAEQIAAAKKHFQVQHFVIGHTIVDDISIDHSGSVIRIDIKHGTENSRQTRGLLIMEDQVFKINGLGHKTLLN